MSWLPIALICGGLLLMALLSAITTPDEKKKVVYIEKDLKSKKGVRRKKASAEGDSGGELGDSKIHPTTPWGGA